MSLQISNLYTDLKEAHKKYGDGFVYTKYSFANIDCYGVILNMLLQKNEHGTEVVMVG